MMAVLSSGLGVVALAFTGFDFVTKFLFYPLLCVVFVTYFYGVVALPYLLSLLRFLPKLANEAHVKRFSVNDGPENDAFPPVQGEPPKAAEGNKVVTEDAENQ